MGAEVILEIFFCIGFFVLVVLTVFLTRGRRHKLYQGRVLRAPVVVTSSTHTAPGGYVVTQIPAPVTVAQGTMYQAQHNYGQMPMPMAMPAANAQPQMMQGGYPPYNAGPYHPAAPMNANPPSYDTVITGPGSGPMSNANVGYEKQAAYNPNYGS